MSYTIGDLFDRLSIVNCKIWHIEEERRSLGSDEAERALSLSDRLSQANDERVGLVNQINASFRVLLDHASGIKSEIAFDAEDILGSPKNKFYRVPPKESG